MKNYQTILAAVDGSKVSQHAFKKAVEIAKKENAELVICHVMDLSYYYSMEYNNVNIEAGLETYAKQLLQEHEKQAIEAGVKKVTAVLEHGSPKVEIAKQADEKYGANLIVAGATGLGAIEHFLLGSVSEHIARRARCDVLIVRLPAKKKRQKSYNRKQTEELQL